MHSVQRMKQWLKRLLLLLPFLCDLMKCPLSLASNLQLTKAVKHQTQTLKRTTERWLHFPVWGVCWIFLLNVAIRTHCSAYLIRLPTSTFYGLLQSIHLCSPILFYHHLALHTANNVSDGQKWFEGSWMCLSFDKCPSTHICMCVCVRAQNKCFVSRGVSPKGRQSSRVRLTGESKWKCADGSKWKCADVGRYYILLEKERHLIMASSRPSFKTAL